MSIYNVRLYDYGTSQQVRFYQKPVEKESNSVASLLKPEKKADTTPKERTEAQINHSKQVSQNRTKQTIYEITRANTWDWFITLTFDREKIDSSDYDLLVKTTRKWFDNTKRRRAPGLRYIIIPELHKDGIHYHFHGLLAEADGLTFTDTGILQDGKEVYNISDFNLGFTTATRVEDTHRAASYVTKYITKELEETIKGKRRYLASRNCKRPHVYEYNMSPEEKDDILYQVSDDIVYMSTQHAAGQRVSYIELQRKSK